jgi:hypothetical protein
MSHSWISAAHIALLWLGAAAAPAYSQAVLVSGVPAPGASVPAGDFAFHLRFNSLTTTGCCGLLWCTRTGTQSIW